METNQSKRKEFLIHYLNKLGFDKQASHLFLTLSEKGALTVLEASRITKIERTKLYRIADDLIQRGLLEEIVDHKKRILQAADINNIQLLVREQAQTNAFLQETFPTFSSTLNMLSTQQSPTTKVQFYRGKEGIKQMLWNELRSEGTGYVFVYKIFEMFVGEHFFVNWVEEFQRRNVKFHEIRTEIFDQSFEQSPKRLDFRIKGIDIRYISSTVFPITHSMSIYNDVVAIYNWWRGEIFGIEIYNQSVADMQKIFFEAFWQKAKTKQDKKPPYFFHIR